MNSATINKILIYYFTGTGNALAVSNWIKQVAKGKQIDVQLRDISKLTSRKGIKMPEGTLIGIISPTHGFNFPPIMFHFLLRLARAKNNCVFIINTRAGMKLGKLFLPGLSGMAQYFSAIVLKLKGFKIVGMFPVDLPSNWISIHPGLKPKVVESIFKRRKLQTEKFATQLIEGVRNYKALYDIIQDLLITPISILYYFIGRFVLAKSFYASNKCNQCNLCVSECPLQAIKIINGRPYWTFQCESCMHCMNRCPQRAIETAHGYIAVLFIVVDIFIVKWIYQLSGIENYHKHLPAIINKTINTIVYSIIVILFLKFTYRIFHYLLKFRFFERISVYTSLTKYKFWRRYKHPN